MGNAYLSGNTVGIVLLKKTTAPIFDIVGAAPGAVLGDIVNPHISCGGFAIEKQPGIDGIAAKF